jgi:murein DD-endopeptidase MepM/ murein hydrolase activator NlpD
MPLNFPRLASRPVFFVAGAIALFFAAQLHAAAARPVTRVTWQPAKLVRGSPVLFRVSVPMRAYSVTGTWLGHELQFFRNGKYWYALGGIPVETAAGAYRLELSESLASGAVKVEKNIRIATAKYPQIPIHVAKRFTEPTAKQLRQISADKEIKKDVFAGATPKRLWDGDFRAPVSAPISDVFGTERVFNGEVKSRHLGLDYAAPAGTPVHAINDGTVILARGLYFEGGFVVIDHGQGLLSLYLHLSQFKVKEGDKVKTGQLIALSGSSGRATGPHLHLAIRWQQAYLNPAVLLRLQIPQ